MKIHLNTSGSEPAATLKLFITPEPTGDEGEALVAAITVYLAMRTNNQASSPIATVVSRWLEASRRQAVRGLGNGSTMGWGR